MNNSEWPLSRLRPNPNNPRSEVRDDGFPELVASIRAQGVLQPLVVTPDGLILAGHRRFEAAKEVQLDVVPVRVLDSYDPNDQDLICLIENLLRTDLTPIETGRYLLRIQERNNLTPQEISAITGISTPTISMYLRIMRGPEEIKQALEDDRIGVSTAAKLVRQDPAVVHSIITKPDILRADVDKLVSEGVQRREVTYQERRREDIAIVLDAIDELVERLEPYGVKPDVAFGAAIRQVERCMQEGSEWLSKLQNHLIDWTMILRKQEERRDLSPVESRNRSSLLN